MFHVIEAEINWRKARGTPTGFASLLASRPIVAQGAGHPLEEEVLAADHFREHIIHGLCFFLFLFPCFSSITNKQQDGADGLHGVHEELPHLALAETWQQVFEHSTDDAPKLYSVSRMPAHREILRVLRENPTGTITIAVLGPMTNVALAASEEPETFLRVKELLVMGGAVGVAGNISPVAEFNTYADAIAAARVYALTSKSPKSTLPSSSLPDYGAKPLDRLELKLFPLDLTSPHRLSRTQFEERAQPLAVANSPLAQWMAHFMSRTFDKVASLQPPGSTSEPSLQLHDPLVLWYVLTSDDEGWQSSPQREDIRVECSGRWSRGMLVLDNRGMRKPFDRHDHEEVMDKLPGDTDGWLTPGRGNKITRMLQSPGEALFPQVLLDSIFPHN